MPMPKPPEMKRLVRLLFLLVLAMSARAENSATNAPISMARLALSKSESPAQYGWGLDACRAFERFDGLQLVLGSVGVLNGIQLGVGMTAVEARGIQIAGCVAASERSVGIQTALFVSGADTSLDGVQLALFAALIGSAKDGSNHTDADAPSSFSHGIQGALLFAAADRFEGIQVAGFGGAVAHQVNGIQCAVLSKAEVCAVYGIQMGLQTTADHLSGIQFGVINSAKELHGLQLGVWNRAHGGTGVQIGIVNGFGPPGDVLWLPLVNARF